MLSYKQPIKEQVRNDVFAYIVDILTNNREKACCVRNSYVRDVYELLINDDYRSYDKKAAMSLTEDYIELWEKFHKSHVGFNPDFGFNQHKCS